jgi:large subunit ribosomal protein L3
MWRSKYNFKMNGIIGKKIGMNRVFDANGDVVPVTVVEAGPCKVIQIKTMVKDGYDGVQLGFGEKRKPLVNKPLSGHFSKAKIEPMRILREVRLEKGEKVKVGQEIKADIFSVGEKVDIVGISKGLGFQGGVRRHHFKGGPKSHGQSDRLRAPGSIGGSSYPSRVWKGQKMAGRMGRDRVTMRNLEIIDLDANRNVILVKGAVPGKRNSILTIRKTKRG